MSRIWMTGLEADSLNVFTNAAGGVSISVVDPRSGTYHLLTPANSAINRVSINVLPLRAEVFVRVYAKTITNTPNASAVWFRLRDETGGALLDITETGQVWLGEVGVGVDKGNAGAVSTAYQMWEIRFLVDNVAGLLDVRVDGVSEVSDSGIDTRTGAVDTVGSVLIGDTIVGQANDIMRFDDIAINNTLGSYNNSWCGKGAILGCVPIADGTTNEFSRFPDTGEANWEDVNELPPNDDTDYVFATAIQQDELYDVTSMELTHLVPRATQVKAVAWWMYHKLVYNGDGQISGLHAQLGFLQEMPAVDCVEMDYNYPLELTIREENSITSAQFTSGDIDDSEFGFRSKAP